MTNLYDDDLPFWVGDSFEQRVAFYEADLLEKLRYSTVANLRHIAQVWEIPVKGIRKDDIAKQVGSGITDPIAILKAWAKLPKNARRMVYAYTILWDSQYHYTDDDFRRVANLPLEGTQSSRYGRSLRENGWLLEAEPGYYSRPEVPVALLRQLPPLLTDFIPGKDAPPRNATVRYGDGQLAGVALTTLIHTVRESSVPYVSAPADSSRYAALKGWRTLPADVLALEKDYKTLGGKESNRWLTVPPPPYPLERETADALAPVVGGRDALDFWIALARDMGLVQTQTLVKEGRFAESFLALPPEAQHAAACQHYFMLFDWSDVWYLLRRTPALTLVRRPVHTFTFAQLQSELTAFRTLMLRVVASMPIGTWVTADTLLTEMRRPIVDFSHRQWSHNHQKDVWGFKSDDQVLMGVPLQEAKLIHPFAMTLLTGALHWLGLTDLAYEGETLVAVRFNGLGDLFWGRTATGLSDSSSKMTISAPLKVEGEQLFLPLRGATPSHHAYLLSLCTATPASGGYHYRLDLAKLYRRFLAGDTPLTITESWHQALQIAPPPFITAAIESAWVQMGQVRLYQNVALLELADDHILTELKATLSLNGLLLAEITPRLVLVDSSRVESLIAQMERAGYTPHRQTH